MIPVTHSSPGVPAVSRLLAALALGLVAAPARAADAPDTQALTVVLRELLLQHLPTPLVETKHWDRQKETVVGWHVHRDGPLRWSADPKTAPRNDGHWHKLTVTVRDPKNTLALGLTDVRSPEDGRLTFTANVGADVDLRVEQQVWKAGVRLYSGETRGRCQAALALKCEATTRLDRSKPGALLPDAVVRFRVTDAQLFYENLVVEHTLGVGGDAARLLGDAAHKILTRVKPSLERDLLAKANVAVVKAADTKDVRVGLDKLFAGAKR